MITSAADVRATLIRVSLKYLDFSSSLFPVDQLSLDQLSLDVPAVAFRSPFTSSPSTTAPVERSFPTLRRTRRAWCNTPAQLDGNERSLIGICHDISLGGMFFLGPILPVGESVGVTIEFPSLGRVRVTGEVLEHRQHSNGAGMAVRFARLAPQDLAIIARFVAARLS